MFTHSIRWRLQLWLAFLLVCVLSGFGVAVFQLQRVNQLNQIDEQLERRTAALGRSLRGGPPPGFGQGRPPFENRPGRPSPEEGGKRPPPPDNRSAGPPPGWPEMGSRTREFRMLPEVSALFDEAQTNAFYFSVWSRDGSPLKRSTNAPARLPFPTRIRADTRTHMRIRDPFREAYYFSEFGDCVLVGRDITADLRALNRFALWLLAAGGSVLAFGLGGGWWLTTRALRPVEEISAAATRISGGNLAERIQVTDPDNELGRLGAVLNSTFARLEAAFAQQKQFTADASHELRTPLSVLISETQTALARDRSSSEYRETVEACLETAQQMRRLTESLLELARLDAGQITTTPQPLEISNIARDCVERLRPLAAGHSVQIHCQLAPVHILGNADSLAQVVNNLLVNAIHYNKPGGEIRVITKTGAASSLITVTDTGIGISPEDLPHVFERFYRADKSRARAEGRTGLGLAIVRAIVEGHHGTIDVTSRPGEGSTFTVRFPSHASP